LEEEKVPRGNFGSGEGKNRYGGSFFAGRHRISDIFQGRGRQTRHFGRREGVARYSLSLKKRENLGQETFVLIHRPERERRHCKGGPSNWGRKRTLWKEKDLGFELRSPKVSN